MAGNRRKTDDVLAAARRELKSQLKIVRDEVKLLGGEERALTKALSSLNGGSAGSSSTARASASRGDSAAAKPASTRASTRKAGAGRGRRSRGASKSTAERVEELRGHLANGPKSRNDLAAALNFSAPRVQQLLAELGSSVTSRPDPGQRQGKLWSLKGSAGGASAKKPATKRAASKRPAARKRAASKTAVK